MRAKAAIDGDDRGSRRIHNTRQARLELSSSDLRLSKLIEDYRAENERCTHKITELKDMLSSPQNDRFDASGYINDRIYS